MANSYSKCRTNYFSVTDEARFREIISNCSGEEVCVLIQSEKDKSKFGFYCSCNFSGLMEAEDKEMCESCDDKTCYDCINMDSDGALDYLYEELQKILPAGEAVIITEIGSEAMRYLSADCIIITKDEIRGLVLSDLALSAAREMLGNPEFTA